MRNRITIFDLATINRGLVANMTLSAANPTEQNTVNRPSIFDLAQLSKEVNSKKEKVEDIGTDKLNEFAYQKTWP